MAVNKESPKEFDRALERAYNNPEAPQPQCVEWVKENPGKPNPWVDWASDLSDAEPYETLPPGANRARMLCSGCPLQELCTAAALAKPPYSGVRGNGLRFELGKRLR